MGVLGLPRRTQSGQLRATGSDCGGLLLAVPYSSIWCAELDIVVATIDYFDCVVMVIGGQNEPRSRH